MRLVALALGARVEGAEIGEFGRSELTVREPGRLFTGLPERQTCWMSHRDTVHTAPEGSRRWRRRRCRRSRPSRTSSAGCTASSFIPRSFTRLWPDDHRALPRRDLRGRPHVEPGEHRLRADREDPRPGRRRARHLWPVGWGGLKRRRAARAPRDRRSADVRFRRSRPDAKETTASRSSSPSATTSRSR